MDNAMVDLFLFSGQSNMAGRGIICERWPQPAPAVVPGAGWEYRAISAPDKLFAMEEPFGVHENKEDGIDDGRMKTGSMVTAFTNACYEITGVPVVGVSASKGGSSILQWQPQTAMLIDAIQRLEDADRFLAANNMRVRCRLMLWCQGETDGDHGMSEKEYKYRFICMWKELKKAGIEKCFMVRIGKYNGTEGITYEQIRQAQEDLVRDNADVIMVSRSFSEMKERGLMKDSFHYYQMAYNEVGQEAGKNAGEYIRDFRSCRKISDTDCAGYFFKDKFCRSLCSISHIQSMEKETKAFFMNQTAINVNEA